MSPHHWTDDDSYRPDELPSALVVPDDARGQGHLLRAMLESKRRHEAGNDLDDDDAPELTPELMARMRPLKEVDPELHAELEAIQARKRRARGKQKAPTKVAISIRVDRDALATYRATGRGWQTRLAADVERGAARLRRKRAS